MEASTICLLIAIAALLNAARLKYNEIKQARKMRELAELALIESANRRNKVFTEKRGEVLANERKWGGSA